MILRLRFRTQIGWKQVVSDWQTLGWACFGSIAADFMRLRLASETARADLPASYTRPRFYLIALATALIAGGLAVGEGIDKSWLALHVGVSAPFIIQGLRRRPPSLPSGRS